LQELWASSKVLVIFVGLFLVAGLNSIINSEGPLTQNLYGAYGRNTAFIAYLLLISVILSAAVLRRENSFKYLIWGSFVAGAVNVVYCTWVIAFGDFIPWNNPYGNILGTFGNPNFIGAFLGLFAWWSLELVLPFAGIAIWSVILAVALYPVFSRLARLLGGRREGRSRRVRRRSGR
jgi:hypothetical protein